MISSHKDSKTVRFTKFIIPNNITLYNFEPWSLSGIK
jgi:hypothetical protein